MEWSRPSAAPEQRTRTTATRGQRVKERRSRGRDVTGRCELYCVQGTPLLLTAVQAIPIPYGKNLVFCLGNISDQIKSVSTKRERERGRPSARRVGWLACVPAVPYLPRVTVAAACVRVCIAAAVSWQNLYSSCHRRSSVGSLLACSCIV